MKRILLIEDEPSIAELQRDYLEINQFEAHVQHSGEEGLERALNEEFDLIILDIMLPKLNGFEVCKRVRAVKDIPILLVSAKKEEIDKIRGLGLGADDYITKPFSPGELVARVKAHLSRYERLSERNHTKKRINVHHIELDKLARRVFVYNQEVTFTTKEFDLLLFLVTHPNQVLSKEQLFENLWGFDSTGDISTVTVHVRKVREKIEQNPAQPQYLETIWGAGYRFNI
ncbi:MULTISPECIES: response regulator transcription factor [Bacillaceae]|uniref:response regulator transcription factor n=1 Tax=Bacillaceae TaxID=186817 RepID=UPI00104BF9AB|nr:response regulator transcription factor [Bacillus sp. CBEL-1]TDB54739.1 response regulator transcription factor [Bacillus sp. CBEL-1]